MSESSDRRKKKRKEGNVLFNNAHFFNWLYCIGDIVQDHSNSNRESPLLPQHGLFFLISSKGAISCSTTGVTKVMVCAILTVGWYI